MTERNENEKERLDSFKFLPVHNSSWGTGGFFREVLRDGMTCHGCTVL